MKLYRITKDGFEIGCAVGKRKAVNWLKKHFEVEGMPHSYWGKFISGILIVKTADYEFRIEEGVIL